MEEWTSTDWTDIGLIGYQEMELEPMTELEPEAVPLDPEWIQGDQAEVTVDGSTSMDIEFTSDQIPDQVEDQIEGEISDQDQLDMESPEVQQLPAEPAMLQSPTETEPALTDLETSDNIRSIAESLRRIEESVLGSDETVEVTTVIEVETETTTDVRSVILDELIKSNQKLDEYNNTQVIMARDQQTIGTITIGCSLVLIGAFVVYLFLGRIR